MEMNRLHIPRNFHPSARKLRGGEPDSSPPLRGEGGEAPGPPPRPWELSGAGEGARGLSEFI